MTTDEQRHRANAAYAIGHAMEAASKQGVPDMVIVEELIRIALALVASANGGEAGLADWLEREAAAIRARSAKPTPTVN